MLVKTRCEPAELKLLRYLNRRKILSEKEMNYYLNMEKGFLGEKKFDEWIQTNLSKGWLVLHDLLLEYNHTVFQIDTLIISPELIYLFEVKNYEGDFYIDGERWYAISNAEIKNPIHQLSRNEPLFRRLLQDLGYKTLTEAKIIFINPAFYLYQVPLKTPIIFSSQLNRFANKLNMKTFEIKDRQLKLAEKLVALHLKESPYIRLPDYSYNQLVKGIPCAACHSFMAALTLETLICESCGCKEAAYLAVMRSVEEYKFLFPNCKVTTNSIQEWCEIIQSKKTIQRVLSKNFKKIGYGKYTYYVEK
ncbi:nuclease-related domain-containing protein [Cytobacillus massiliigabonensis]|uniref:nuclease-related domain-containing protein n=1 Tax=Cytobacillus massiliigabonensis TaxID=1871011 RepID=UPI000C817808|nr:nuclease-related domain-containing protein [Cytobacillus massiliigabonensis]